MEKKRLNMAGAVLLQIILLTGTALAGNNSGGAFSVWPDTGQTKCYDNTQEIPCPAAGQPFNGQDAQYTGPARSYTVIGNGTMVWDNTTGLIWEIKNSKDDAVDYNNPHDADNYYPWCDPDPATNGGSAGNCVDFDPASGSADSKDFIDQLNSGSGFGGYTDWRLPTASELASLADLGRSSPPLTPALAAIGRYGDYWTSTTPAAATDYAVKYAWCVNFGNEHRARTNPQMKNYGEYVRAVRGGQPPAGSRYRDNNDGTVTDTVTCLQWQKSPMTASGGYDNPMTWQAALSASENLNLAGHSDWRLPNLNELHSLVDYSRANPAIDPVFNGVDNVEAYWSSTTGIPGNTSAAWQIYFTFGNDLGGYEVSQIKTEYGGFARAVRGEQCGATIPIPRNGGVNLTLINFLLSE